MPPYQTVAGQESDLRRYLGKRSASLRSTAPTHPLWRRPNHPRKEAETNLKLRRVPRPSPRPPTKRGGSSFRALDRAWLLLVSPLARQPAVKRPQRPEGRRDSKLLSAGAQDESSGIFTPSSASTPNL